MLLSTAKVFALLSMAFFLVGCAGPLTGYNYGNQEARQEQTVRYGVIREARLVKIDGQRSGVGTLGGAALGGIAGSTIGGGKGKLLATVGGAILGGLAGDAVEKSATKKQGVNLFVKLCSGEMISVVQELDPAHSFREGDHVAVLTSRDATRVTLDQDAYCDDTANRRVRRRHARRRHDRWEYRRAHARNHRYRREA